MFPEGGLDGTAILAPPENPIGSDAGGKVNYRSVDRNVQGGQPRDLIRAHDDVIHGELRNRPYRRRRAGAGRAAAGAPGDPTRNSDRAPWRGHLDPASARSQGGPPAPLALEDARGHHHRLRGRSRVGRLPPLAAAEQRR